MKCWRICGFSSTTFDSISNTACKTLKSMGIKTIGDVAITPQEILKNKFGEIGKIMHDMANGIDKREVIPSSEPKSVGRETTFEKDTDNFTILKTTLLLLSRRVSRNLHAVNYKGNVLTLKVRFSDFKTITKRITLKNIPQACLISTEPLLSSFKT